MEIWEKVTSFNRDELCVMLQAAYDAYKEAQIRRIQAFSYNRAGEVIVFGDMEQLCDAVDDAYYKYQQQLHALRGFDREHSVDKRTGGRI